MFNVLIALTAYNELGPILISTQGLVKDIDGYVYVYRENPSQWEYKVPVGNVLYIRATPVVK